MADLKPLVSQRFRANKELIFKNPSPSIPSPKLRSIYQENFIPKPLGLLTLTNAEKKINSSKMRKEIHKAQSIVKKSSYTVNGFLIC